MSDRGKRYQSDLLTWIAAWQTGRSQAAPAADFDAMALALFAYQFDNIAAFRTFCLSRHQTPADTQNWRQIPCVPISAFKFAQLHSQPAADHPACRFETSGTTDAQRGHIQLSDTALYDASALAAFRHWVLADETRKFQCISLIPDARVRPNSSLGHMVRHLAQQLGVGDLVEVFGQDIDLARFVSVCQSAAKGQLPVLIFATTIAIEALLQKLPDSFRLQLPRGSRVMDTGGPKGRAVALNRETQHEKLAHILGVDRDLIVGEYGMTELCSQRYETTCRHKLLGDVAALRGYVAPPWLKSVALRPSDRTLCAYGEVGMLAHIDLANLDTCAFVLTADLGKIEWIEGVGEVLTLAGRLPGSDWRGCGLDAEAFLAPT